MWQKIEKCRRKCHVCRSFDCTALYFQRKRSLVASLAQGPGKQVGERASNGRAGTRVWQKTEKCGRKKSVAENEKFAASGQPGERASERAGVAENGKMMGATLARAPTSGTHNLILRRGAILIGNWTVPMNLSKNRGHLINRF